MEVSLGLGFPALLSEQVDSGAVLPLQALHSDLMCRHPGTLDALVCGPQKSDGNPTLHVSARPRVGLLPLCCEESGCPFRVASTSTPSSPPTEVRNSKTMSSMQEV